MGYFWPHFRNIRIQGGVDEAVSRFESQQGASQKMEDNEKIAGHERGVDNKLDAKRFQSNCGLLPHRELFAGDCSAGSPWFRQ